MPCLRQANRNRRASPTTPPAKAPSRAAETPCPQCASVEIYVTTGQCKPCGKAATKAKKRAHNEARNAALTAAGYWNSPEYRQQQKDWRKNNRMAYLTKKARYRARQLQAYPLWLTEAQEDQIDGFYREAAEREAETGELFHVDHIVPLQGKNVCGLHVPWNLQVLPATDNLAKNNRFDDWVGPEEFRQAA